jgi:hypothetical protein
MASSKCSTTGHSSNTAAHTFEITHPFHPLCGKQFVLATRRQAWGEDRINYFNSQGKLCSILAAWTSLANKDYFLEASAGRSWFRAEDIVELDRLLQHLNKTRK